MAGYPLQPLLAVRQYREDSAQNILRRAEHAVREAERSLETCRQERERYQLWRRDEEDRRYEAIMGQLLRLDELDAFKAGLARLRDAELQREEDETRAAQALDMARKTVLEAKDKLREARRETARILAHKDIWIAAARLEAERKEDLENEEFKTMSVGTGMGA